MTLMRRIICLAFISAGITPTLSPAVPIPPTESWQTIAVIQETELSVRLKVLRTASLANPGWMVIEIENKSNIPLTVKDAHYRLESERDNLKTGQLKCSGGLASGNTYDLFPEAWKTVPVSPIVL